MRRTLSVCYWGDANTALRAVDEADSGVRGSSRGEGEPYGYAGRRRQAAAKGARAWRARLTKAMREPILTQRRIDAQ